MTLETLEQRIQRAVAEDVSVVPYNAQWPELFRQEKEHLLVESHFEHWDRLLFRDYLIAHLQVAAEYQALKFHLATVHPNDRVAYTKGKTEFIVRITEQAKEFYGKARP